MAQRGYVPTRSLVERRNAEPDWDETAMLEGMDVEYDQSGEVATPAVYPDDDDSVEVIEDFDDGSVVVDFDPRPDSREEDADDFFRNLVDEISDDELANISGFIQSSYTANKESRAEWEDQFKKGIDLLGFKFEERTQPFKGASSAAHPLLAEAAYQFQAQAYNELLPPEGPVKTVVLGASTQAKRERAARVREFMNYYTTERMDEYVSEFDQMLFSLPLAGSTFKKTWYDETLGRAVSRFIPGEKLIVPYGASDLETCDCVIEEVDMALNTLRKHQVSGFYADVPVSASDRSSSDEVQEAKDEAEGVSDTRYEPDEIMLYEAHVALDIDGFEDVDADGEPTGVRLPYIVTVAADSGEVLGVRRNYDPDDDLTRKINYYTHYKFLPGFGFYGIGLIHAIGGLTRAATAALRQLLDAGTLANLPGGFKSKQLRVANSDEPIQPGEFRDVDGLNDDIRLGLMPLPYKEPSQTLLALLGVVVDAGRRFATITDMKTGEGGENMAMGTVIALLEQGGRVMSAIHKRIYNSMRKEFKILRRLIRDHMAEDGYPFDMPGVSRTIKAEDFGNEVDIIPVADPNIFSASQRIMIAQASLEAAQAQPDLYNMHEVNRRYLQAIGTKDVDGVLRARPHDVDEAIDPAHENINALDRVDLRAFKGQDHEAHIMSHMVFGGTPMVAQMPLVAMALQKHIMEHVRLQAEEEAEVVAQQHAAQTQQPLSETEMAAMVAHLVAQGMMRVQELSRELSGGGEEGSDPVIALKAQELQQDAQNDAERLALDQQKAQNDAAARAEQAEIARQRIRSQEAQTQARIESGMERARMQIQARSRQQGPQGQQGGR